MDWQQVLSTGIVACAAILLARHLIRRRSHMSMCNECACAVGETRSADSPGKALPDGRGPAPTPAELAGFMHRLKLDSEKSTLDH